MTAGIDLTQLAMWACGALPLAGALLWRMGRVERDLLQLSTAHSEQRERMQRMEVQLERVAVSIEKATR